MVWIIGIGTFIAGALFLFFDEATKVVTKAGEFAVAIENQMPWLTSPRKCTGDMTWEERRQCEREREK